MAGIDPGASSARLAVGDFIADLARDTTSSHRRGLAELERLLVEAGLAPRITPEAITLAVHDELEQHDRWLRDALAHAGGDAADTVEAAQRRLDAFRSRMGWLTSPPRHPDVASLDPRRDAARINHFVGYAFRVELELARVLAQTRSAVLIPSAGTDRIRHATDACDIALDWGVETARGAAAVRAVVQVFEDSGAGMDGLRLFLLDLLFVFETWNARLGWRPFTAIETLGRFYAHLDLARAVGLDGLTDDYYDTRAAWLELSERAAALAPTPPALHDLLRPALSEYSPQLRPAIATALSSAMDPVLREVVGAPSPARKEVERVRQVLRCLGEVSLLVPPVPWIRSLHARPSAG